MRPSEKRPTICALATPQGVGAQGTIKISGPDALSIASQIFTPARSGIRLTEVAPYTAWYGYIRAKETGEVIDDVMLLVMRAPHSYTGEDQVEITCHGAPLILHWVMQELLGAGAELATAGEFTRRALSNGKLDLSQAEGVADLIASSNKSALRLARSQMKGLFSQKIHALRDQLIEIASLLELELDFSEEEVEFVDRQTLREKISGAKAAVTHLAQSYHDGQVIKKGIPIAILGQTNAGKSTLLNALLQEERAIVSDIHGTTRDFIEGNLFIEGQEFRIIDTAGIRQTSDQIEHLGIKRALERAQQASLVLWVIDPTYCGGQSLAEELQSLRLGDTTELLPLINKCDLLASEQIRAKEEELHALGFGEVLAISAEQPSDVSRLKEWLHHHFAYLNVADNEVMVTNLRQAQALEEAATHLGTLLHESEANPYFTGDLMAQELRAAIHALSTVTGAITTDDLLSSIFANFCIGK